MGKQRANMSFQQSILMASRAQTRGDIKAEVEQAMSVLLQETKKSLISMKQRLDAIQNLVQDKLNISEEDIQDAIWEVQEKVYGLERVDTPAAVGNALRFRVKEEKEGEETDTPPTNESYLVLGNDDNEQLPKEIIEALTGSKSGDEKKVTLYSEALKSNYVVTIAIDRVYKEKKDGEDKQRS